MTITNTAYNHSQSVVDRLTKLRTQCSELPMTLVLDNAAYQRCAWVRDKAAELNIQLLFLPPYSPNLNLIARLRKFVQAQCLNSVYHEPFGAFKQAMDASLKKTAPDDTLQLATLLTLKLQPFKAS
ncbi:MAG: transposase [Firmicutes bacterium]|nr:transposase [Bacillota bacterium]